MDTSWLETVQAWWNSAWSSGLAQIAGLNMSAIGLTIKSLFTGVKTTKVMGVLSNDVAVVNDKVKTIDERLATIESDMATLKAGVNAVFIAINTVGQNSSILPNAKAELATLSASVMPLLNGQKQLEAKIAQMGEKLSTPLSDADKAIQAKKDELTKLATDQTSKAADALNSLVGSTFNKFQAATAEVINSAKEAITGTKQA